MTRPSARLRPAADGVKPSEPRKPRRVPSASVRVHPARKAVREPYRPRDETPPGTWLDFLDRHLGSATNDKRTLGRYSVLALVVSVAASAMVMAVAGAI